MLSDPANQDALTRCERMREEGRITMRAYMERGIHRLKEMGIGAQLIINVSQRSGSQASPCMIP